MQLHALCIYLEGPDGCAFVEAPDTPEGIDWECEGALTLTRQWLGAHGLDIDPNVEALEACGGFCDCEVVFNVRNCWADYLRANLHDSFEASD